MKSHIVEKINFKGMKNETHVQFGDTVGVHIGGASPDIIGVLPMCALFKNVLAHEKEALDFGRKSGHTEPIMNQDDVRDRVYRGLSDVVKGLMNHYDPTVCADAKVVWDILEIFGNITQKSLDDETAAINDLQSKLDADAPSKAIEHLKLTDWVKTLGRENAKFQTLMMDRYDETSAKTHYRMRTARLETERYYRGMVSEIENLALRSNVTPELSRFIDGLNAIILRFNAITARHTGVE